ncbi:ATP-dependent DNA helicase [Methanosphaerula subterraneus]|uniref:ATP-dependent DNA helicase n=1 Tax=Methanosphaerula subterraneus TaxID=3350244 RepID=UPI003F845F59
MTALDDWFPYSAYRPHQREMLETSAAIAAQGGIAMIDAPTGSGKSSVIAALLSESRGRKVIVAVRTVSQLNTFIRELQLIRKKQRSLKFAYLVGKGSMCPLGGEGDVYRRCEGVKAFSSALMREQAQKGMLNPAKDPQIRNQIRRMDKDHPLICPYYVNSRIFVQSEDLSLKMVPSGQLRSRADRIGSEAVAPRQLHELCGEICPYEAMLHAARHADVIVLNYHHLFTDEIRDQLYTSLGIESPGDVLLLIDEAHNCGDTVQSIQSVSLDDRSLEQASHELAALRRHLNCVEPVEQVLPQITNFMQALKRSTEVEDWFDPSIFNRMVIRGSLYRQIEEVVEDLQTITEFIREKNTKAGEYKETAIEQLADFLYRIYRSSADPAYLTVFRRLDEDRIALEVRNIDPADRLQAIARAHACCIMISGTLSPVESYRRYYFGDLPVTMISLPNAFPTKNRLILCSTDITTAYSMRQSNENLAAIDAYITAFATVKGNIAVYFPSYQLLETFAERCRRKVSGRTLFVEPKDSVDAGAALKAFMDLPRQGGANGMMFAVCGGKWSEGLDYRGEMLSGALVIGLPLAPFNKVRKMVIDYFRHKFGDEGEFISYTLPAINRATQALGRVLRTPEDRGVLVLGEKRFWEERVKGGLSQWMQQEMKPCDASTFREAIKRWR